MVQETSVSNKILEVFFLGAATAGSGYLVGKAPKISLAALAALGAGTFFGAKRSLEKTGEKTSSTITLTLASGLIASLIAKELFTQGPALWKALRTRSVWKAASALHRLSFVTGCGFPVALWCFKTVHGLWNGNSDAADNIKFILLNLLGRRKPIKDMRNHLSRELFFDRYIAEKNQQHIGYAEWEMEEHDQLIAEIEQKLSFNYNQFVRDKWTALKNEEKLGYQKKVKIKVGEKQWSQYSAVQQKQVVKVFFEGMKRGDFYNEKLLCNKTKSIAEVLAQRWVGLPAGQRRYYNHLELASEARDKSKTGEELIDGYGKVIVTGVVNAKSHQLRDLLLNPMFTVSSGGLTGILLVSGQTYVVRDLFIEAETVYSQFINFDPKKLENELKQLQTIKKKDASYEKRRLALKKKYHKWNQHHQFLKKFSFFCEKSRNLPKEIKDRFSDTTLAVFGWLHQSVEHAKGAAMKGGLQSWQQWHKAKGGTSACNRFVKALDQLPKLEKKPVVNNDDPYPLLQGYIPHLYKGDKMDLKSWKDLFNMQILDEEDVRKELQNWGITSSQKMRKLFPDKETEEKWKKESKTIVEHRQPLYIKKKTASFIYQKLQSIRSQYQMQNQAGVQKQKLLFGRYLHLISNPSEFKKKLGAPLANSIQIACGAFYLGQWALFRTAQFIDTPKSFAFGVALGIVERLVNKRELSNEQLDKLKDDGIVVSLIRLENVQSRILAGRSLIARSRAFAERSFSAQAGTLFSELSVRRAGELSYLPFDLTGRVVYRVYGQRVRNIGGIFGRLLNRVNSSVASWWGSSRYFFKGIPTGRATLHNVVETFQDVRGLVVGWVEKKALNLASMLVPPL